MREGFVSGPVLEPGFRCHGTHEVEWSSPPVVLPSSATHHLCRKHPYPPKHHKRGLVSRVAEEARTPGFCVAGFRRSAFVGWDVLLGYDLRSEIRCVKRPVGSGLHESRLNTPTLSDDSPASPRGFAVRLRVPYPWLVKPRPTTDAASAAVSRRRVNVSYDW